MCGRYAVSTSPGDLMEEFEIDELLGALPGPDYNVAPTVAVPAVLERVVCDSGAVTRRLSPLVWGLVPSWAKDRSIGARMINARLETVAVKPAFRKAFAARRCLLPADGFYEWYTPEAAGRLLGRPVPVKKQPFFIHRTDGALLVMAGLYEIWRDPSRPEDDDDAWLRTCTVITTEATDAVGQIHDRMPMVVPREAWSAWLDPHRTEPAEALALLGVTQPDVLEAYPVSTAVNSVRNNDPSLLEPLAAEPEPDDPAGTGDPGLRTSAPVPPTEVVEVTTPEGPGRLHVDHAASSADPGGTLVLGHGAGGGVTAPDLQVLARRLPPHGVTVVRFEQPWRVAGGRVAVRPPRLDVAWLAAVRQLLGLGWFRHPLVVGGRSAGARVACRTATPLSAEAVVCLAFPLHLPGRPERSRAPELAMPEVPRLVLQGTRDSFGTPMEIRAALPAAAADLVTLVELPGADHSFRLPSGAAFTGADLATVLTTSVLALLTAVGGGEQGTGSRE